MLRAPDEGLHRHPGNILAKSSNLNLITPLVPTTNFQATQWAEERVKKPQKGNQQDSDCKTTGLIMIHKQQGKNEKTWGEKSCVLINT